MALKLVFDSELSREELRGFARTVAEIEWVLLVLVLLYQLVLAPDQDMRSALSAAMFLFAAFVLTFHYINFYSTETPAKLMIETLVMIGFITWVLYNGTPESPHSTLLAGGGHERAALGKGRRSSSWCLSPMPCPSAITGGHRSCSPIPSWRRSRRNSCR
jgi:hypothetical protein